jgi:hypothetical protein
MATPVTRTASGETWPAKETSKASVYATLLDGATFAMETTKSPHKLTAFALKPTWGAAVAVPAANGTTSSL